MSQDDYDYLWDRRHAVRYRLELSALYHQKRERFFEAADKLAKAVAILGGSAAIAHTLTPEALTYVAAAITVTSTCSLVFGLSDKARRHAELARSFKQIESDMLRKGERDFGENDLAEWSARVAVLEAAEPPTLGNLVRICQNELARAGGQAEKMKRVGFVRGALAHFFDLPMAKT